MDVPMPADAAWRLPRHPDWKYEYWDGELHLSHRPRWLRFVRSTAAPVRQRGEPAAVRMIDIDRDEPIIRKLLHDVWLDADPYRSYPRPDAGPFLDAEFDRVLCAPTDPAGAVAVDKGGVPIGAVLLDSTRWDHDEPANPTLTWLSVSPGARERGVATAMLALLTNQLAARGVATLYSGASGANLPSLRWHLTNGFILVPDPLREALAGA